MAMVSPDDVSYTNQSLGDLHPAIIAQNLLLENMEKYVNPVVFSVLSTDLSLEGV